MIKLDATSKYSEELLDKECIDYAINIVDHAAEPMAGTIVTVRQLIQFVRTFIMQFGAN